MERTLFRLASRSAYSSRTSCSRGLQAGPWLEGGDGSAIEPCSSRQGSKGLYVKLHGTCAKSTRLKKAGAALPSALCLAVYMINLRSFCSAFLRYPQERYRLGISIAAAVQQCLISRSLQDIFIIPWSREGQVVSILTLGLARYIISTIRVEIWLMTIGNQGYLRSTLLAFNTIGLIL